MVWVKIKDDNKKVSCTGTSVVEQSMDLLLSIRHPLKARTVIPAPVVPLPASIAPVSIATEREITSSLVSELNNLHCLNLTEQPEVKRDSGLLTPGLGGCKLVMVGASHTAKITALTRHSGTTEYIPLPG